jgi:ABC-type transporter Mla subunit MlaD
MKTALFIALLALLVALTGGVLVFVHDVHRDLSDFHSVLDQAGGTARAIEGTTGQLNRTIGQINTTVAQVNTTVATLNDAANAQKKNWLDASTDVKKTGDDTRRVVAHVDRILTHFDVTTLPALDMQIVGNGDRLQDTIARLGDSADGITAAAKTLDTQLSDPQIPQLLGHFNTISGNLELTTANFATMTSDAVPAVHRFTAAPTKKQKFLAGAKDFGGLIYLGVKIATLP